MAFAAVGALVSGGLATASAGTILAAVAEVGLAMTAVGVVTGSKELTKLGGALGLVGGIGGLINGAVSGGVAAAGESLASGAVESIESAAGMADAAYGGAGALEASQMAGLEAMGAEVQGAMEGFGAKDWEGMLNEAQQSAAQALGMDQAPGVIPGVTDEAASGAARAQEAYAQVQQTPSPTQEVAQSAKPIQEAYNPAKDSQAYNAANDAVNGPGDALKSYTNPGATNPIKDILDWAKSNKELSNGFMTIIGGGMSGIGAMRQADMQQEANRMRFQYGNQVANFRGQQPTQMPLIGARR